MSNLTEIKIQPVEYTTGTVKFNQYDQILSQAKQLAEYIKEVEVNPENVKQTKKMLAEVNKKVEELEDNRISIKKEMMKPYQDFETQVKEIVSVVKDADSLVRSQVKDLEEAEREEKKTQIIELFDKRAVHYPDVTDHFESDDFITQQHLNKSVTMTKVEEQMVEWFESRQRDLKVIRTQDDVVSMLEIYTDTQDLSLTFDIYNQKQQKRRGLEQINNKNNQKSSRREVQEKFIIILGSEKDFTFAKMLLDQNGIDYDQEVIKQ